MLITKEIEVNFLYEELQRMRNRNITRIERSRKRREAILIGVAILAIGVILAPMILNVVF